MSALAAVAVAAGVAAVVVALDVAATAAVAAGVVAVEAAGVVVDAAAAGCPSPIAWNAAIMALTSVFSRPPWRLP